MSFAPFDTSLIVERLVTQLPAQQRVEQLGRHGAGVLVAGHLGELQRSGVFSEFGVGDVHGLLC